MFGTDFFKLVTKIVFCFYSFQLLPSIFFFFFHGCYLRVFVLSSKLHRKEINENKEIIEKKKFLFKRR